MVDDWKSPLRIDNMPIPHIRKPNRHKNYDYSKQGAYFTTICSKNMKHIFSVITTEPVGANSVRPKPMERMDEQSSPLRTVDDWKSPLRTVDDWKSPLRTVDDWKSPLLINENFVYPKIQLTKIGNFVDETISSMNTAYQNFSIDKYVIMPNHIHLIIFIDDFGRLEIAPTNGRRTEVATTMPSIPNIVRFLKSNVTKLVGVSVWQKLYYDHIIRDENDYLRIGDYILNNPSNWITDEYYTQS